MRRRPLDVSCWADRDLSYAEIGATADASPTARLTPGYHRVDETRVVGVGATLFDAAAGRLMDLAMHRGTGNEVVASAVPVELGTVIVQRLRLGPLRFVAPCRVVDLVDEPSRRGFAYGTLEGHPESGEERFEVAIDANGRVTLRIAAFSRQGRWFTRLAPGLARVVQGWMTDRYFRAMQEL
ncbi:DUF1990 family protein [Mumia sp. Pv 4-285]|uniref:DUF1990 family protein n=1 Tax=Mumia qirimensis TaxID=3234852 RepID=UPI00351D137F